jgi:hypothetical protein
MIAEVGDWVIANRSTLYLIGATIFAVVVAIAALEENPAP